MKQRIVALILFIGCFLALQGGWDRWNLEHKRDTDAHWPYTTLAVQNSGCAATTGVFLVACQYDLDGSGKANFIYYNEYKSSSPHMGIDDMGPAFLINLVSAISQKPARVTDVAKINLLLTVLGLGLIYLLLYYWVGVTGAILFVVAGLMTFVVGFTIPWLGIKTYIFNTTSHGSHLGVAVLAFLPAIALIYWRSRGGLSFKTVVVFGVAVLGMMLAGLVRESIAISGLITVMLLVALIYGRERSLSQLIAGGVMVGFSVIAVMIQRLINLFGGWYYGLGEPSNIIGHGFSFSLFTGLGYFKNSLGIEATDQSTIQYMIDHYPEIPFGTNQYYGKLGELYRQFLVAHPLEAIGIYLQKLGLLLAEHGNGVAILVAVVLFLLGCLRKSRNSFGDRWSSQIYVAIAALAMVGLFWPAIHIGTCYGVSLLSGLCLCSDDRDSGLRKFTFRPTAMKGPQPLSGRWSRPVLIVVILFLGVVQFNSSWDRWNFDHRTDQRANWHMIDVALLTTDCATEQRVVMVQCNDGGGFSTYSDFYPSDDIGQPVLLHWIAGLKGSALHPTEAAKLNHYKNLLGFLILAMVVILSCRGVGGLIGLAILVILAFPLFQNFSANPHYGHSGLMVFCSVLGLVQFFVADRNLSGWRVGLLNLLGLGSLAAGAFFRHNFGIFGLIGLGFALLLLWFGSDQRGSRARLRQGLYAAMILLAAGFAAQSQAIFTAASRLVYLTEAPVWPEQLRQLGIKNIPANYRGENNYRLGDHPAGHVISHNLYLGLGYEPKVFGIESSDTWLIDRVKSIDPAIVPYSRDYSAVVMKLYLQTVGQNFAAVVRLYYQKFTAIMATEMGVKSFKLGHLVLVALLGSLFGWLKLRRGLHTASGQPMGERLRLLGYLSFYSMAIVGLFIVQGVLSYTILDYLMPAYGFIILVVALWLGAMSNSFVSSRA